MVRFLKILFSTIFGIFVLVGVCIAVFLTTIDFSGWKGMISEQSQGILGRPIIIAGSIRPGLSIKKPTLVFNDVTFKAMREGDVEIHAKIVVLQAQNLQKMLHSGSWKEQINFNIELVDLTVDGQSMGFTKMSVATKGLQIDIKPLSFHPLKAGFYGEFHYDMNEYLQLSGQLTGFDYGQFSKDITGKFNASIELSSKGKDVEKILSNLQGKVLINAGEGQFSGRAVDLWAADFLTTLLPMPGKKKHTGLICGVGLFDIKNGQANSKIVINTDNVLIQGKGSIDLAKGVLDLKFKPKPKKPSLLSIATPLHVTGDWADPSITPTAGGILAKVGGILLTAVNPAALALPLLKLGMTENNPCMKILTEKPE